LDYPSNFSRVFYFREPEKKPEKSNGKARRKAGENAEKEKIVDKVVENDFVYSLKKLFVNIFSFSRF